MTRLGPSRLSKTRQRKVKTGIEHTVNSRSLLTSEPNADLDGYLFPLYTLKRDTNVRG